MTAPSSEMRFHRWARRIVLGGFVVATLLPLAVALKTAVAPDNALFEEAGRLAPSSPTWFHFARVLGLADPAAERAAGIVRAEIDFARSLANSLVFTTLVVIPQILCSALAAYAFARLRFRGARVLFRCFIAASMVPGAVLFIPNFILVRDLGWLNTFAGMAAPFALMTPFAVFYLRQVFLSSPLEIEEAARMDGASMFRIFWMIVLPVNKGPLATLTILSALATWNEFFWPYLAGREESVQVLAVAINAFRMQQPMGSPDWTGLMACAILGVVPMVILLLVLGRKIVESVQFSGGR